jgi:hypothetical protein
MYKVVMRKIFLLFFSLFFLANAHLPHSLAETIVRTFPSLSDYVGKTSNKLIDDLSFTDAYSITAINYFSNESHKSQEYGFVVALALALQSISSISNDFPVIEQIDSIIIARIYNCNPQHSSEDCLGTAVLAYDTTNAEMFGCVIISESLLRQPENYKYHPIKQFYFLMPADHPRKAHTMILDEPLNPFLCSSKNDSIQKIWADLSALWRLKLLTNNP